MSDQPRYDFDALCRKPVSEVLADVMSARLRDALLQLADGWEHGYAMAIRSRYTRPSDYAAELRAVIAKAEGRS